MIWTEYSGSFRRIAAGDPNSRVSARLVKNVSLGRLGVALSYIGKSEIAVERWPRDPQRRADLVNAKTSVPVEALGGHNPRIVGADRPAAALAAPCPGSSQALLGCAPGSGAARTVPGSRRY